MDFYPCSQAVIEMSSDEESWTDHREPHETCDAGSHDSEDGTVIDGPPAPHQAKSAPPQDAVVSTTAASIQQETVQTIEVRRDSFRKLKTYPEFLRIYGPNRYITMWDAAGVKYGVFQRMHTATVQKVSGTPSLLIDASIQPLFQRAHVLCRDPAMSSFKTAEAWSAFLERELPARLYASLFELYTLASAGQGKGHAMLLDLRGASYGQLAALEHWAVSYGFHFKLEKTFTTPRGFFISIFI
jgi:hypothetical protein